MKRAALFAFILFTFSLAAQTNLTTSQLLGQVNTINPAVPFLLIDPDARGGAMGDCGAASSPDAFSGHWNPGKPAFLDNKMCLGIGYTPWLRALVPSFNLAYLSGYYRTDKKGTWGGSLRYMSYASARFTNVVGNSATQFTPNEFALDLSYSTRLGEHYSAGTAVRYIYSDLTNGNSVNGSASYPGTAFAADLGIYYKKTDTTDTKLVRKTWGISLSNLGSRISYYQNGRKDYLPANLRLGGGISLTGKNQFSFSSFLDLNKLLVPTPIGNTYPAGGNWFSSFYDAPGGIREEVQEITLGTGLEVSYRHAYFLRGGYFYEAPTKGNRNYFTLGCGISYSVFELNLCYLVPTTQRNPLEHTLRFSLAFNFGKQHRDDPGREGDYY